MSEHTICLLNDSFPPTIDGVANVVLNYANIIEKNHGHSVVVTPQVPDTGDNYPFPVVRYPSIDTRKLVGYVTGYPFSPEAAHVIKEKKTELLHTHCPMTSCLLARQLSESMDLPLIMTWHTKYDIDIANAIHSKALQETALQALLHNVNACDEVWTVSNGAGENLRSLGYKGDYIVMPNGVDLPHKRAAKSHVFKTTSGYDLPPGVPCFLFIGRLMWYKGLRIILDALAMLMHQKKDFRMIFIGGGGDESEVKAYAASLGLERKVFFKGPISARLQLRAWYTRADLFLFPSTFDTNGLVVREAAASDTASVMIRGSCASEGIKDGQNGFLIEENAQALAAKLSELISFPDKMKEVGRSAGREIYISWDEAVGRAYDRYETVIDRYMSGYYKKRLPYDYDFFRAQGELMESLGNLEAAGHNLKKDAEALRSDIDTSLRSFTNKAVTEAIEGLETARNDIWEFLDRYL